MFEQVAESTSITTSHTPREAVLYSRVSSRDQERGGFSIPAQQKLLRGYARDNSISVVAEFTDVETAGRAGRTDFGAMLRFLERQPLCKAILVEKTDRLYRNLRDWVTLDDLGAEVHLVKEGVVLSEESVSSEKFVHGIKVLVAKNFLDNLSEETRKGMLEKARQGLWPSRAPVGYLNASRDDAKRIILPDPELGPIVAEVFGWYASGRFGLTELTARAEEAGLVYRQSRKPMLRAQVHLMLRNPIYMGDFDWLSVRYKGTHEPLVSRKTWDRVQEVLTGRAPWRRKRKERKRRQFTFSGLIRCGTCADEGLNFLLVAEIKKERYIYYRCEECKRRRRARYIREEKIVEAFTAALAAADLDRTKLAHAVSVLLGEGSDGTTDSLQREVDHLEDERRRLQASLDLAYDDRLAGRISAAYFEQRSAKWKDRFAAIRQDIADREAAMAATRTKEPPALELGELIKTFQETPDPAIKKRFVMDLCSNLVWKEGKLAAEWR